jgi:putative DNA primase/helicase
MNSLISEYIEHGFALVPIPLGKKGPTLKNWNDAGVVIKDKSRAPEITGNVGLAHAYCKTPTAVLDIDNYQDANALLKNHNIDLDKLFNATNVVRIDSGRLNRGKILYKFPIDVMALETIKINDPQGNAILELRSASKNGKTVQDVLPPSIHPDTGQTYQWAGAGNWKQVPEIPDLLLEFWKSRLTPVANKPEVRDSVSMIESIELPEHTIQHLRSALLHLRSDNREDWVKTGLALKSLGQVGRGLWMDWSMTSRKYDPLVASDTWETFEPATIDYKHVFAEAQRQGWVNPTKRLDFDMPIEDALDLDKSPEPQKLPGVLRPVPPLNPDWLPEVLRAGCVDIAERLNCPLDYVAIPAIVGAGTVLGNTVGILPKEHDDSWVVHAGFWGGIVGSPGSMKTPALISSLKPLHQLEETAAAQYKQDCIQYLQDKAQFDKGMVNFKTGKSNIFPIEPSKPVKARLIVNDVTYQALGEILAQNPSGILALADELSGLLQSLDTAGQEAARGFYLSGWGGQGSYTFDRITRESVTLSRYQLAVFGGFQPDRIKAYVRFAQSGSSKNDGLLQRFQLLVWPDLQEHFDLIDRPANKEALSQMQQAIVSLKHMNLKPLIGTTTNHSGVQLLHFDKQAQILFNNWFQENEGMLRNGTLDPSEHGHFAKYRSLIPGLALLFHLVNGDTGPVNIRALETALLFSSFLKSHAKRIYGSVHGLDSAPTRSLAKKLLEDKITNGFTQRSLLHKGWANLSNKDNVSLAVNALVEHKWLTEHASETAGRKTMLYKINPRISEKYL